MSMSDPLADMCTRIRNALSARHESVRVPASKVKRSIADVLRSEGFRTAAIVTNPWLRAEYGFDRGFDEFQLIGAPSGSAYVSGQRVNELAGRFLEAHANERFFLYLHYMDVHSPYTPPLEHRAEFLDGRRGRLLRRNGPKPHAAAADVEYTRRLYAAEVRGFDDRFRELWAVLEGAGVDEGF